MRTKAFPTLADNGHITTQDGMDLRDYFAAKIMQSLVLRFNDDEGIAHWNAFEEADIAYEIADAMMEARKDD